MSSSYTDHSLVHTALRAFTVLIGIPLPSAFCYYLIDLLHPLHCGLLTTRLTCIPVCNMGDKEDNTAETMEFGDASLKEMDV
jgi:hypothetical protein